MGLDLDLSTSDGSIECSYFSKAFINEIILEDYIRFSDFLNVDEEKALRPNLNGEVD